MDSFVKAHKEGRGSFVTERQSQRMWVGSLVKEPRSLRLGRSHEVFFFKGWNYPMEELRSHRLRRDLTEPQTTRRCHGSPMEELQSHRRRRGSMKPQNGKEAQWPVDWDWDWDRWVDQMGYYSHWCEPGYGATRCVSSQSERVKITIWSDSVIWSVIDSSKTEKPPQNVVKRAKKTPECTAEAQAGNTRSKVNVLKGVKSEDKVPAVELLDYDGGS